jgi:cytochrome P450
MSITKAASLIMAREVARQVSEATVNKHPTLGAVLEPLAGRYNMLTTTDYAFWKKWRSIFNPAFSNQQVMSMVSG